MRRFAPAERRSLSRLGRCRVFQRLEKCPRHSSNDWKSPRNAVSSRRLWRRDSLISTPAMFQVPEAVTSNTAPEAAGQIVPTTPQGGCRDHLLFRREEPAGRSSRSRARHRSGWRGLAVAGVGPLALRGPALPGSLRAHPSRHPHAA